MRKPDDKRNSSEQLATPRTLADIPRLGPIRIRALTKAGYDTPSKIKAASVTDLAQINGMSEIKAQQTLDYLAQFAEFVEEAPVQKPAASPQLSSALSLEVIALLRRIVLLLIHVPADTMRGRLVREVERLADAVAKLSQVSEPEAVSVLLLVVQDISRQIDFALSASKPGKKAQAELAEILLTASMKLSPDVVV